MNSLAIDVRLLLVQEAGEMDRLQNRWCKAGCNVLT